MEETPLWHAMCAEQHRELHAQERKTRSWFYVTTGVREESRGRGGCDGIGPVPETFFVH